ncbi:MAG TPA: PEGA domain-containing protein [Vicinamibacterales bacterium]|nr:PEGA domain-containing protein [Vicinamibacterales bacterium]
MHPPPAFGAFRVLHQIGSGVLGPVFRSYDSQRERLVVIKAFRLDLPPSQIPVFVESLRGIVTRPVDAPGVVRAVDAGIEGNLPYLALEFVSTDHETLDAILRESRPMTAAVVSACCRSIAEAIDAAWDVGIGHGALHPRDVFVRAGGEVTITGFGVAQALESAGARAAVRQPYAAPERAGGGSWDRRSDLFALGAMAQELVLKMSAPSVEVAAVLDKALADAPSERYASAAEFASALETAMAASAEDHASPAAATTQAHRTVVLDETPAEELPIAHAPLFPTRVVDVDDVPADAPVMPAILDEALPIDAPRFPWAAIAAVATAALTVGGLLGYRVGFSRANGARIEREVASVTAQPAGSKDPASNSSTSDVKPIAPRVEPPPTPAAADGGRVFRPGGEARPGSISVDSRPRGARVMVDGKAVGQTPLRVSSMSPGDHRVLIELQGHRRVTSTVKVVAGEQARLAVSLEQTELARLTGSGRRRN